MAAHTVYAVASGKGGVGKTATTVNLGASLAEAGYTVAIVDTDLGMANLGGFIGIEPEETLHEVLAGDASLEAATYEALNGLAVVPSGISLNGFANVETAALADAVDALRDAFDYVLLDLGAGLSHDTVLPLALADAVILVSTPRPAAVQDTAKTRQITERLGGRVAGVVLTRAGSGADMDLEEVEGTLDLPVLAVIPEDEAVPASAREGKAVLQYDEESRTVEGYRGLAGIIEDESLANAPVVPEPREPAAADEAVPDEATEAPSGEAAGTVEEEPTAEAPSEPEEAAGAGADREATAEVGDSEEPPREGGGAAASADAGATEPAGGTAEPDEAERTAAEIAAAIEDAAGGTVPDADEEDVAEETPTADAEMAEEKSAADETPSTNAEAGEEEAAALDAEEADATGEDEGEVGAPVEDLFDGDVSAEGPTSTEAVEEAVEEVVESETGKETLTVESSAGEDSEEGEAVDELFSVEGTDDDEDEDDESGGLLGGLLG